MLTIGKLGEAAGVKVPTIRYYEQIGLLPECRVAPKWVLLRSRCKPVLFDGTGVLRRSALC